MTSPFAVEPWPIPRLQDYPARAAGAPSPPGDREDSDTPLVSVVTVVRNGEEYLREAIASVASQGYPNIEYIIVDGGSTDGTLGIIEEHRAQIDYWISEPDEGIFDAMNKGIALCRGALVKLLNADDLLTEGAVAEAVRLYRATPGVAVIASEIEVIDEGGRLLKRLGTRRFMNPFGALLHPSWFVARDAYAKLGLYVTALRVASDYELFVRFHQAGARFVTSPRPLARFRSGGASDSLAPVWERYAINRRAFSEPYAARILAEHLFKKLRGKLLFSVFGERRAHALRRHIYRVLGVKD